ncbi:MAG: type II secretion system F family protein [Armatimonadetes bacterium]|nr:type II secretion system F family protein [Armatimonadota bacterium]
MSPESAWLRKLEKLRPVPAGDLVLFFRQLHMLANAGIPLHHAMDLLRQGEWSPRFREAVERLTSMLHRGHPVAQAMRAAGAFPSDCVGLMKVAEETGMLVEVLSRCATLLEREDARRRRVWAALTYPLMLLLASAGLMLGMMLFFIPRMADVLRSLSLPLGAPTEALLWVSDQLLGHPAHLLLLAELALVCVGMAWLWSRSDQGAERVDEVLLAMPVIGKVVRALGLARLSYSYSLMQRVGVPAFDILRLLPSSLKNRPMARALVACRNRLVEGASLAESFAPEPLFGGPFLQMVEVGEVSSKLEHMLEAVSRFYDERLEETLQTATALIEPVVLMGMGAMVGGMILLLMLPLGRLVQQL